MSLRLMVVDEMRDAVHAVREVLQPRCEVIGFNDISEARQQLMRQKFHAALLESNYELGGTDFARQIRSSPSNNRILIGLLTGATDTQTMVRAFASGVNVYMCKPASRESMLRLFNILRRPMVREHVRYARVPVRSKVRCTSSEGIFEAESVNISTGGMLLANAAQLSLGRQVELSFMLPELQLPVQLRAKVVRRGECDTLAVRFAPQPKDIQLALETYVQKRRAMVHATSEV